jgi:hypothetical protein
MLIGQLGLSVIAVAPICVDSKASRPASGHRSPGPPRRKPLTYFGSGDAFVSLERANGFVDGSALVVVLCVLLRLFRSLCVLRVFVVNMFFWGDGTVDAVDSEGLKLLPE